MVPQLGPQEPEEPTALARIEIPPFRGFEGAPRGLDRGTHVVLRPGGDPRNRSVRRGVEDLGGSPRGGDPFPSDVVAMVFDVHRESASTIGVRPISVWILPAFTGALLFSAGRCGPEKPDAGRRAREPPCAVAGGSKGRGRSSADAPRTGPSRGSTRATRVRRRDGRGAAGFRRSLGRGPSHRRGFGPRETHARSRVRGYPGLPKHGIRPGRRGEDAVP